MRALFCVAMILSSAAAAQSIDVKNARLGMTESELVNLFPTLLCRSSQSNVSDRTCVDVNSTYGGANASLYFAFLNNSATVLSVTMSTREFDTITAALKSKYGEPSEITAPIITNRMGAKFENTTMVWARGDETLTARRYTSTIDKAGITVLSKKSTDAFNDRRKEETTNRAKDL